jgi:hypothetical protein
MLESKFAPLRPLSLNLRAVFGTQFQPLQAHGLHFGPMFGPCRSNLGKMNRSRFEGLGTDGGTSRRRDDPIVERFQGRFRGVTTAILK